MTILIVGGTGTLGRHVTRELIERGYSVRCLVRNTRKAAFLSEWGAELVYGDLKKPETIPNTLKHIRVVIDISTLRNEDEQAKSIEIDLIGKIVLIKAAMVANIKGFIFFSITNNDKFSSIPLMCLKNKIEKIIKKSKIPCIIFRISSFYQGLINQYAIPILEQKTIFITTDNKKNTYSDTQDIAKICSKLLIDKNNFIKYKFALNIEINGQKELESKEIITKCEEITGQKAKINLISIKFLDFLKKIMSLNKWTWDIEDRLAFNEFYKISDKKNSIKTSLTNIKDLKLNSNLPQIVNNLDNSIYKNIKIYNEDMSNLELYLEEYFENILEKLKVLNYVNNKIIKRKDLTF
jgi:hypothetical protein